MDSCFWLGTWPAGVRRSTSCRCMRKGSTCHRLHRTSWSPITSGPTIVICCCSTEGGEFWWVSWTPRAQRERMLTSLPVWSPAWTVPASSTSTVCGAPSSTAPSAGPKLSPPIVSGLRAVRGSTFARCPGERPSRSRPTPASSCSTPIFRRSTRGSAEAPRTKRSQWLQQDFTEVFARTFIADARRAYEGILNTTEQLARDFPDVKFVLRPHPFEDATAYLRLRGPNLSVRQEGSALEWIALCRLLIHQNCSTALEAIMMGVEPLSLDWLNTPALKLDGPTSVSQRICSYDALRRSIERSLSGRRLGRRRKPTVCATRFDRRNLLQ